MDVGNLEVCMNKQKLEKMNTTEHYRMYKSGK
ncbi:KxYKxGKxW signal peptide domain-containing protein [Furfurilactobacillus siliginis]